MVETAVQPGPVEHPRGIYPGRVDEKGRLKLPAAFQQYLTDLGATKVFITSFDVRIARIYPLPVWKEIEELLKNPGEDADDAEDLWFTAMDLGADAEMDAQGRLLISPELRRALTIENAPVYLEHYKGHINVFGQEIYNERKERAAKSRGDALKKFERRGLQ
jgi:MraZ protein